MLPLRQPLICLSQFAFKPLQLFPLRKQHFQQLIAIELSQFLFRHRELPSVGVRFAAPLIPISGSILRSSREKAE